MYIPIKNKSQIKVKDKGILFVDNEDFKLKLKTLNNLIVYNSEEIILEIPDDQENNSSSSGSENVQFEGGDAKFVYKITDAEYEDMNGYYYFDENNSRKYNLIYRNSETNAVIKILSDEVSIASDLGYISSGPLAGDGQIPHEGWEFYSDDDLEEISTIKLHRINKFYLKDGTYCKLIVSCDDEDVNGEYYCIEELKDINGMGYDVYMKCFENASWGIYLMYMEGYGEDDDTCNMVEDGYAFVHGFDLQEPGFYKTTDKTNPAGSYTWADHPGWWVPDGGNMTANVVFDE